MFLIRVLFHLLWRFCWLALWGMAYGLFYGLLCGVVSGGVLGLLMGFSPHMRVVEGMLVGAYVGAAWAASISLLTSAFVFGITGLATAKRRFISDEQLRKDLGRGVFRGSTLGTLCGMTLVPCAFWLVDIAWRSLTNQSLEILWPFTYIGGVIISFIMGVIISAIWVVCEWKTPKWPRFKR